PGHQEVDVVEPGNLDRAAEYVKEEQHEHDRLDGVPDQEIRLAADTEEAPLREDEHVRGCERDRAHFIPPAWSSSVPCPVSCNKTSSRVGETMVMPWIAPPTSSSWRTALTIAPRRSRSATRTAPTFVCGAVLPTTPSVLSARSRCAGSAMRTSSRSP